MDPEGWRGMGKRRRMGRMGRDGEKWRGMGRIGKDEEDGEVGEGAGTGDCRDDLCRLPMQQVLLYGL